MPYQYEFVSLRRQFNKNMEIKGVITGDIIGSSQIRPEFKVDLLTCIATMKEKLQCVSPFRMELYRGDSFQLPTENR